MSHGSYQRRLAWNEDYQLLLLVKIDADTFKGLKSMSLYLVEEV